jgi:hypothetical protein
MEVINLSKTDFESSVEKILQRLLQPVYDRLERIELRQKGTHAVTMAEFAHLSGFSLKIIRQMCTEDGYKGRRIEFRQLDNKGKIMIPIEQLSVLNAYQQGVLQFEK